LSHENIKQSEYNVSKDCLIR